MALLLMLLITSLTPMEVFTAEGEGADQEASGQGLKNRARIMLQIANRTASRIRLFINRVQGNDTLMAILENASLLDEFKGNVSALEEAEEALLMAETLIEEGNYTAAIATVREALATMRKVYMAMYRFAERCIKEKVKVEERASGLIVAMNRTLERLEKIEGLAGEEASQLIEEARGLLNITEAKKLLAAGNVSEVAERLAQANKIMGQIFKVLRNKARERFEEKTRRFIWHILRQYRFIADELRKAGLNASEILEESGIGNLSMLQNAIAKMRLESIKKAIRERLKIPCERLRILVRALPALAKIEKPDIIDILNNPEEWSGKTVSITGEYRGWKMPKDLPGPSFTGPPKTRSDWIISDETGWIYVSSRHRPFIIGQGIVRLKGEVTVVGVVKTKKINDDLVPYLEAKMVFIRLVHPSVPPISNVSGALSVSVDVLKTGNETILKVTVTNNMNETVVFPNSVYGLKLMRRIGKIWIVAEEPVSAQVLVELKPGESGNVTVKIDTLPHGVYKVVVHGWLKDTKQRVVGFATLTSSAAKKHGSPRH